MRRRSPAQIRDRLEQDAHAGRLAANQARKLKGELRALTRDEARACSKRHLTEAELRDFSGRLQRLSDDLARAVGAGPGR